MNTFALFTASTLCLLLFTAPLAHAQSARDHAQQTLEEAQAHEAENRHALAAQRYLEVYELMQEAGMSRAPLVLWNAGDQLARVPGREREALETLRRFLHESVSLADEAALVRDWRSNALSLVDELEARLPAEVDAAGTIEVPAPADEPAEPRQSISPVGPALLGIGGATVVAGAIMGAVAFSQGQELLERCPGAVGCDGSLRDDEDTARTLATIGDAFWIGGGIVAAAGLLLTLVLTDESEPVAVAVHGARGGATVHLRGSF